MSIQQDRLLFNFFVRLDHGLSFAMAKARVCALLPLLHAAEGWMYKQAIATRRQKMRLRQPGGTFGPRQRQERRPNAFL